MIKNKAKNIRDKKKVFSVFEYFYESKFFHTFAFLKF